jgi:hypothetical protein
MFKVSGYRDIKFVDLPEIDLPGSYKLLTAPLLASSHTLCFSLSLSLFLSLLVRLTGTHTDGRTLQSLTFVTIFSTDLLQDRAHRGAL